MTDGHQFPDGKTGYYYVTMRDGRRTAFLLGPFVQRAPGTLAHRQALGAVESCRSALRRLGYPGEPFAAFGTSRLPLGSATVPAGKLGRSVIAL